MNAGLLHARTDLLRHLLPFAIFLLIFFEINLPHPPEIFRQGLPAPPPEARPGGTTPRNLEPMVENSPIPPTPTSFHDNKEPSMYDMMNSANSSAEHPAPAAPPPGLDPFQQYPSQAAPSTSDAWNPHPAGSDPWATRPSDPWNTGSTDPDGNYVPPGGGAAPSTTWNSGRDSLSDALGR